MADKDQRIPPVPTAVPIMDKLGRYTPAWVRWLTHLRDKLNVINENSTAQSTFDGVGIVVRQSDGALVARQIAAGTNVVITHGDGTDGNPTITSTGGDSGVSSGGYLAGPGLVIYVPTKIIRLAVAGDVQIAGTSVVIPNTGIGSIQLQTIGGQPPFIWSSGALPSGITMATDGTFSYDGTQTDGTTSVAFTVTASTSNAASAMLAVRVLPPCKLWRVKVLASNSLPNYGSMQELQFRASPGGATLCTGGTPFCSSYYLSPPYLPSYAFDGDVTSTTQPECWAASGSETTPFLGYILPTASVVAQIMICARHTTPAQSPKDFTIQSSIDSTTGLDGTWVDEWSVTGQTGWGAGEIRTFSRP